MKEKDGNSADEGGGGAKSTNPVDAIPCRIEDFIKPKQLPV